MVGVGVFSYEFMGQLFQGLSLCTFEQSENGTAKGIYESFCENENKS